MSNFPGWPGQGEFHGRDEFDDFFTSWTEAYEDWDQEIEELLDASAGRVIALMRQRGRLPGGDSWVELAFGVVYTVEDGRIRRGQVYGTPQAAIEAAGLSE
jgi:ketosteroid isomerase-like protein